MTEKQSKWLYFPAFRRACVANRWRVQDGCTLNAEPLKTQSYLVQNVLTAAAWIAAGEHRAVTLADIRYACHYVATGRVCSSKDLKNREITHLMWLFKLLVNPDDLNALRHWLNPELDEKDSLIARLADLPGVSRIAREKFQVIDWRQLELGQLKELTRLVANKKDWRQRPLRAVNENEPF